MQKYRIPAQFSMNFGEMVVDNFAGGGGASMGIEAGLGRPVDVAINHDPGAVAMHLVNHPLTRHLCESVWDIDPREITSGRPVGLVWFSPDCKHFSKAKGGKPVDYIIDRTADGKRVTATEQVKRCGNSVPPAFAEALVRANYQSREQKYVRRFHQGNTR